MPHILGSSVSYRIAVGPLQGHKAFMIRTIRPLDQDVIDQILAHLREKEQDAPARPKSCSSFSTCGRSFSRASLAPRCMYSLVASILACHWLISGLRLEITCCFSEGSRMVPADLESDGVVCALSVSLLIVVSYP